MSMSPGKGISLDRNKTRRARTKNASYIGDKFVGRVEEDPTRAQEESGDKSDSSRTLTNSPLELHSEEDTELMQPMRMYFRPSEYNKQVKISTRCYIHKAVETLNSLNLQASEKKWFYEHPQFKHFFHMHADLNHKVMGMWMLLLRTAEIEKKREAWFVVNGVPIRYSLREHALISGLDCHSYPENFTQMGGMKFAQRQFGQGVTISYAKVEEKLLKMKKSCPDRLKMCVLYFLSSIIVGKEKTGAGAPSVDKFFIRAVDDLKLCETFPWGRYAFDQNLRDIQKEMNDYKGVVSRTCKFPSFCTSLEMLAFEAISKLNKKFREDHTGAKSSCPRMCKSKFRPSAMKGFPLSDIYEVLGNTKEIQSVLVPTADEERLLDRVMEDGEDDDVDDVIVDCWMKHIDQGKAICFEKMYNEDVSSREEEEEEDEDHEEEENEAIPVENAAIRRCGENAATISMVVRLEQSMDKGFKKINDKIDGLDKRVLAVEGYVKEQVDARRAFEDGMDYYFNDNHVSEEQTTVTDKDPNNQRAEELQDKDGEEKDMEEKDGEEKEGEEGVVLRPPEVAAIVSTEVDMVAEEDQEKEGEETEKDPNDQRAEEQQDKDGEEKDMEEKDGEEKEGEEGVVLRPPEVAAIVSTEVDMVAEEDQEKEGEETEKDPNDQRAEEQQDKEGEEKDGEEKEGEKDGEGGEKVVAGEEGQEGGEKDGEGKEGGGKVISMDICSRVSIVGDKKVKVIKRKRSSSEFATTSEASAEKDREKEPEQDPEKEAQQKSERKITYKRRKTRVEKKEGEKEVVGGEGRKKKKSQLISTPFTEEKGKRVTRQSKKQS